MVKRGLAALLLALSAIVVVFVPGAVGAGKDLTKIKICYANQATDFLPLWVADKQGFFEQNGLDPELVLTQRGTGSQVLISGGCQISMDGIQNLEAIARGADLVAFGGDSNRFEFKLVVRTAANIDKVTDLKGKTLALSSPTGAVGISGMALLKQFGLSDKDVKIVYISSITARLAALASGNIDAMIASPPVSSITKDGKAKAIYDLRSLRFILVADWTKRDYAKDHPEVLRAFLRSWIEGSAWMKKAANRSKVLSIIGDLTGFTDAGSLKEAYDYTVPSFQDEPVIDNVALKNSLDYMNAETGKNLGPADVLYTKPLEQVLTYTLTMNLKSSSVRPKPKASARARGSVKATLNQNGVLKWKLTYGSLTGKATAAYIQVGKPGANGPVKARLCKPCRSGQSGTIHIGHGLSKSIKHGLGYVTVRTKRNAGGEIRGQISAEPGK